MINEVTAVSYVALVYAFSFPIGYLLLRWGFGHLKLPFFVKFPIFLALGLVTLTLTLFVIGFFGVNQYVTLFVFLLSLLLAFSYFMRVGGTRERWRISNIKQISLHNTVPLLLFAVALLLFSFVAGFFGWPPFGDAIKHGIITSLLVSNGRIRLDYMPLSPAPLDNPIGFHVLSASFSMLTGALPGESLFVLAAAALILVPLLLYSLTYLITRSIILSASAFFSTFIIDPVLGLDTYLTGYLYNGPYPNLFGFLGVILFCVIAVIQENQQTERHSTRSMLLMLLVILSLLATYSPFTLFLIAYVLLRHPKESCKSVYTTLKRKWILVIIILAVFAVVSLLSWNYLSEITSLITLKLGKIYVRSSILSLKLPFLFSENGIAVIVGMFIAVFFLLKRIQTTLALFDIIVVAPCFASMFDVLSSPVSIILPSRSIVIATLVSWVLIFVFLWYVLSIEPEKVTHVVTLSFMGTIEKIDLRSMRTAVVCLILASAAFGPGLISNVTLGQTPYSWFGLTRQSEDYSVFLWVHENIGSKDLILNDYSYTSLYLLSFSIKNVTSHQTLGSAEDRQRAVDAHNFWKKPNDYVLFSELVNKYDIKYVLVTSESGYLDWVGVGGDGTYKPKPFRNRTKLVFDENPYLKSLFTTEHAGVYKVTSKLQEFNFTDIADDRQSEFWRSEASGSGGVGRAVLWDDLNNKMSRDDSLGINVGSGTYAHVSIVHYFISSMDWSTRDFVAFYWLGNNTGADVKLFVRGPTTFDYMLYGFVDSWVGWRLVVLPLRVPAATYGNPDLTKVVQIQFTILHASQGTWHLDQIALATKD